MKLFSKKRRQLKKLPWTAFLKKKKKAVIINSPFSQHIILHYIFYRIIKTSLWTFETRSLSIMYLSSYLMFNSMSSVCFAHYYSKLFFSQDNWSAKMYKIAIGNTLNAFCRQIEICTKITSKKHHQQLFKDIYSFLWTTIQSCNTTFKYKYIKCFVARNNQVSSVAF